MEFSFCNSCDLPDIAENSFNVKDESTKLQNFIFGFFIIKNDSQGIYEILVYWDVGYDFNTMISVYSKEYLFYSSCILSEFRM